MWDRHFKWQAFHENTTTHISLNRMLLTQFSRDILGIIDLIGDVIYIFEMELKFCPIHAVNEFYSDELMD